MRTLIGLIALLSFSAMAETIQILHTNDLHSHLDHSAQQPHVGGYGRLRVKIRQLRQEAKAQGIGTIAMDGGDFLEGNIFYVADNGRKSAQAYNKVGFDVAVLGNHDYLMAAADLETLLKDVPPSMALLAANLKLGSKFPNVNTHIKPVWETVVNGVKVGVIGITLKDMLYKWRLKGDGEITDEVASARYWARYLKGRGNEVIIALTHIGFSKDKKLAASVPELDLIVGGHDHDAFKKPFYQESYYGKMIPIVQAGEYGEQLGRTVIDFDRKTKSTKLVSFSLEPVHGDENDQDMLDLVTSANADLDVLYGVGWLEEVLGLSYLRPKAAASDTDTWHFYITDSMRESMNVDFAVHANGLSGNNYPVGDVTRRKIYNGNPRHFDFSDKLGYHIYTAYVSGFLLKTVAHVCLELNVPLYFSGLSFKWYKKKNGKYKVWDLRHKGRKIKTFKRYKVAFSEAIVRGGLEISSLVKLVFHIPRRTPVSMWTALEEKFRREGELYPDYLDTYYEQQLISTGVPYERVLVK